MKRLITFMLLLPLVASAQKMGGMEMDQAQMQQMMQKMQGLQNCMAKLDQTEMKAFQQKGMQINGEVKALCSAGKRDEAMERAITFSQEVASSKLMQEMKKCGDGMQSLISTFPKTLEQQSSGTDSKHICDSL